MVEAYFLRTDRLAENDSELPDYQGANKAVPQLQFT
jgi:hypothetical protein